VLTLFFKDSVVYGLVRVLTSATAVVLMPLYTRWLTPAHYGIVDLVTVLSTVVQLLATLEIAQAFGRYYADPAAGAERGAFASTALLFTVGGYAVFLAVVLSASGPITTALLGSEEHAGVLRLAALAMAAGGVFTLLQNQLRYDRRSGGYAAASVVFSLTSLALVALLLVVARLGIAGVFVAQLVAGLAGIATALALTRGVRWRFDVAKCSAMLRFSLPLVVSSLGVFVALYADRLAISRLMSLADLGVYAAGARIASLVALAMAGFQIALPPLIYQRHERSETPGEIERVFRWFLAVTLPLVLFVGLFAGEALAILATAEYAGGRRVVFLLAVAFLVANMYMFAPGAWIAGRTGCVAAISLGGALCNIVLNLALIPRLGIRGAALATGLSALLSLGGYVAVGQRCYPIPYRWGRVTGALALVLLVGAAVAASAPWTALLGFWGDLLLRGVILVTVSLVAAVLLLGVDELSASVGSAQSRLRGLIAAG